MTTLHIYSARMQPATKVYFGPELGIKPFWSVCKPNRLMWCWRCNMRRPAKNLVTQVYYDQTPNWCAPGKGCHGKSRREIRKMAAAARARRQRKGASHDPR